MLLAKVISKPVISICTGSMLTTYFEEYTKWLLESVSDCKNYEDQLEGILTLYNKVGKTMEDGS